jgi:hypothetical protein
MSIASVRDMALPRKVAALAATMIAFLSVLVSGASNAAGATAAVSLLVPSSTAFSMLGRSCGGIQQQAFATGFADTDGYPTGAVYLQTRCGGSGRGGGYRVTTYSAWSAVTWGFDGIVRAATRLPMAPAGVSPTFAAADAHGDSVYNALTAVNVQPANCSVGNTTYCSYRAYLTVPAPGIPTVTGVSQSGDALVITWTPSATGGIVANSTVTATPVTGPVLSATVAGAGTSASVPGVAAATTYSITVTSGNAGGTSATSAPALFTTHTASVTPGAPTGVSALWSPDGLSLRVSWSAGAIGDSPITDYQIGVAQYDPTGPMTLVEAGIATSASVPGFDNVLDWSVQVRACNAAGCGAWSQRVVVGGL